MAKTDLVRDAASAAEGSEYTPQPASAPPMAAATPIAAEQSSMETRLRNFNDFSEATSN
jgi:hypothetical protein